MAKTHQKKWYEILPWWGWILSILISSQLSTYLTKYFSGLIPNAIAAALGFLMVYSIAALVVYLVTIPKRKRSKKQGGYTPTSQDLDECIENWSQVILKAPLIVWTKDDLLSQTGSLERTQRETYAVAGVLYLAEHMVSRNVKNDRALEMFSDKLLSRVAELFAEQILSEEANRADKAEYSSKLKKAYFYYWNEKKPALNTPKGSTDLFIDIVATLDKTTPKSNFEENLKKYLVSQRFADFANIASHILNTRSI